MNRIERINKPIVLKFEDREFLLPEELKEDINQFWKEATKENPNLYNGQDYVVESVNETDEQITMIIVKSNYAHYLYDERVGIKEKEYKSCSPWGGILLITKDDYLVIGEMDQKTSIPYSVQISGGGIDITDIDNGYVNIDLTIKRELKEELNQDLDEIDYKLEFIEYPDETRNAYGFIAYGKIDKTKDELNKEFEAFKKYLIENNLEIEYNRLIFLKKSSAIQELDAISNYKRPYLKSLIEKVI